MCSVLRLIVHHWGADEVCLERGLSDSNGPNGRRRGQGVRRASNTGLSNEQGIGCSQDNGP